MAETKKKTLRDLQSMKAKHEKITFITSYEYQMARLAEQAGIDMILVGDSAGNNLLGYPDTRPVTMDQMIMLASAARKGAPNTFMVGDMPLGSYQPSDERAIDSALRFIKESQMDSVKCEGGERMVPRVKAMADAGIAVMGHIGYTPQSTNLTGIVRGNRADSFRELRGDALALQEAGAFAILLEAVPNYPAGLIAEELRIPIYGIGAGREVDGVLAIINDVLGLGTFQCRFVKPYCNLNGTVLGALTQYVDEVRKGVFPADEHLYPIKEDELAAIRRYVGELKGAPLAEADNGNGSS